MRLYVAHLHGAAIAAAGWGGLGLKRFVALQFALAEPQRITDFRIGVYTALAAQLSAGSGGYRFGLDGVRASTELDGFGRPKWRLLHARDGRLLAAVPAHSYGRQVYLPHCSLCSKDDKIQLSEEGGGLPVGKTLEYARQMQLPPDIANARHDGTPRLSVNR